MSMHNLSFDPLDPLFPVPGLSGARWGIQVFTRGNLYTLDRERIHLEDTTGGMRLVAEGLSWAGRQRSAEGRVEAEVVTQDGTAIWTLSAWHDEPIKAIKLVMWDLPEDALRQGWWTATSSHPDHPQDPGPWSGVSAGAAMYPPSLESPLLWQYPQPDWLTSWACTGEGSGALCLSVRDPQVRPKRLYVFTPPYAEGKTVVELVCEEDARHWDGHFTTPEIRLHVARDTADIDADFAAHLQHVEQTYQLQPWEKRPDVPDWLRDIRLILNLHGQHWTGFVFNTFDRMADALRFVTQYIPGEQVLAYLPGWEGRYYWAYPFFRPGEDLGGEEGFARLMATARELGVHVMPMFGANGANALLYPNWEQASFRSRGNRLTAMINMPDWDSDRAGEDDQIFLNPGEPNFRRHLVKQLSAMIRDYDLDAVYLDTTACWFNDPRYNLYEGYRALLTELREQHPGVMVAGEGWWDALLALFPINLSWVGVDRHFRYPELLTRYGRAMGHLADGAPGWGSTGVHEDGFHPAQPTTVAPGHIPSLSIVRDTLAEHADDVARICRAAAGAMVKQGR